MKLFKLERKDFIDLTLEIPLTGLSKKEFPKYLKAALNGTPTNDYELASAIAIYKSAGRIKVVQLTTRTAAFLPTTVALLALHNVTIEVDKNYFEQLPLFVLPDTAILNGCILSLLYAIDTEYMDKVLNIWVKNQLSFTTMLMLPPTLLVSSASWMANQLDYFWEIRTSLPYLARVSLFYLLWDQVFDPDSSAWRGELGHLIKQNPTCLKYWSEFRTNGDRHENILIVAEKLNVLESVKTQLTHIKGPATK